MNSELVEKKFLGEKEKKQQKKQWKYYLDDKDEVVIPKFNFNTETNYSSIEEYQIKTSPNSYIIEQAYQRKASILDEKGARIESEAEMKLASEEREERPKPKKMRFDKPFFILLKKINSANPYFVLFANNAELMIKE